MIILTPTLPISEVTVLEDRAHIVRVGTLAAPAGRSRLRLPGVSAVLSDKTAIATISGAAQVRSLRVERTQVILASDQPAALAELTVTLRTLERRREELLEARHLSQLEHGQLATVVTNTLTEIAQDVSYARDSANDWKQALDQLAEREHQLQLQQLAGQEALADLQQTIDDLTARLSSQSSVAATITATLWVEIEAPRAGDYQLRIAYLVPGACWRPYHTARWQEGTVSAIELSCDACVWQNTGEDWNGVTVRCSTERSSLGTTPPLLTSDLLTLKRKETVLSVEVREQTVQTMGGEAGAPAQEVMGIDDGGETRLLTCPGAVAIPSDGLPHRIPLYTISSPCESALVVQGELTAAAITRTSQTNTASVPLLAGPVDLIRRDGLAGRTSILYIAAGSRFDLGWGPDGDIRVHRTVQAIEEKAPLLSTWQTQLVVVDLHLSNLGASPRAMTVIERIPVSSLEQVLIELDGTLTKPPASADANGFVTWTLTLAPYSQSEVALRYRVKKHPSVVGL